MNLAPTKGHARSGASTCPVPLIPARAWAPCDSALDYHAPHPGAAYVSLDGLDVISAFGDESLAEAIGAGWCLDSGDTHLATQWLARALDPACNAYAALSPLATLVALSAGVSALRITLDRGAALTWIAANRYPALVAISLAYRSGCRDEGDEDALCDETPQCVAEQVAIALNLIDGDGLGPVRYDDAWFVALAGRVHASATALERLAVAAGGDLVGVEVADLAAYALDRAGAAAMGVGVAAAHWRAGTSARSAQRFEREGQAASG